MIENLLDQEDTGEPYRALYKDSTDHSVRQLRDIEGPPAEVSRDDQAKADEAKSFAAAMAATGTFDINVYLQEHPEKVDDAKRLGFL
jgi:hypothetical protein